jgi:hypothetical protein
MKDKVYLTIAVVAVLLGLHIATHSYTLACVWIADSFHCLP